MKKWIVAVFLVICMAGSATAANLPGWFYGYKMDNGNLTWLGVNFQASPGYDFGLNSYVTLFTYQFVNYEDFAYGRIGVSTKDMFASDVRGTLTAGINLVNTDQFTEKHLGFKVFAGLPVMIQNWIDKTFNADFNCMFFVTFSPECKDGRWATAGTSTDIINLMPIPPAR
ncbi:MAG: hypothetical protein PHY56_00265 [Candidatus Omnitrophica bacterium]|nr:hypothetical protein [Candidatus Omnitrophota bacterium]